MRRTQTKPNADLKRNEKLCQIRKCLINNIFDYGDCLDLRNITLQTAIVYIEKLLSVCKLDVIDKDKNLWSLGALSLACKYIELDDNIPGIRELQRLLDNKNYNREIFIKWEKILLKGLRWNLMTITPLHFAAWILNYSVLFGDDSIKITDGNGTESYRFVSNIEFEYEKSK